MSILIKGMKMPNNCQSCPFSDDECRYCKAANKYIPMLGKPKFCPLVEVPTPHGRLIDADEIIEVQMFDEMYEEWTLKTMSVAEYLVFAADTPPTIIEAEEGEEA